MIFPSFCFAYNTQLSPSSYRQTGNQWGKKIYFQHSKLQSMVSSYRSFACGEIPHKNPSSSVIINSEISSAFLPISLSRLLPLQSWGRIQTQMEGTCSVKSYNRNNIMYKLKSLLFTKFFEQAPFTFSNALHQALSPQSRQQGAATEHYSNTQCCSCNGTFGLQVRAYVDTI